MFLEFLANVIYFMLTITVSLTIMGAIMVGLFYVWKSGYLQQYSWYHTLQMKLLQAVASPAANNYMNMFNSMMSPKESAFQVGPNGKFLYGEVSFKGVTHTIYLPYDPAVAKTMRTKRIYSLKEQSRSNISSIPGVPCLITADDIDADTIVICNLRGDVLGDFSGNDPVIVENMKKKHN